MEIQQGTKGKANRLVTGFYLVLASIYTLCVVIQIFIAGLATFVDPFNWYSHRAFVHFFDKLPLLMLIIAFIGRLPAWAHWHSAGLLLLVYVMYFTGNISAILPWAAAAHPVFAVVIFWLAYTTVKRTWQYYTQRQIVAASSLQEKGAGHA